LVAFKVLVAEFSVCFVSDNISLLTPIQEAILSLLYPLVWQGAYISILPVAMIELLEAPVPFIVGCPRACMPQRQPNGVLVIDIDKDLVTIGGKEVGSLCNLGSSQIVFEKEEEPVGGSSGSRSGTHKSRQTAINGHRHDASSSSASSNLNSTPPSVAQLLESVPEESRELCRLLLDPFSKQIHKLHDKIKEFGAGVYRGLDGVHSAKIQSQLAKSIHAFPNNEHLMPISVFTVNAGHAVSLAGNHSVLSGSNSNAQQAAASGLAVGGGGGGGGGGVGMARRRLQASTVAKQPRPPVACSYVAAEAGSSAAPCIGDPDILDPANNCIDDGCNFDAREIRNAFLRFFVSMFLEADESASGTGSNGSSSSRFSPLGGYGSLSSNSSRLSIFSRMSTVLGVGDEHSPTSSDACGGESFVDRVVSSQMYCNFADERRFRSQSSEIRFFNESTLEKRNRSKMALTKALTPFLSDTSEAIRESYTVPHPSSWGLSSNSRFEYGRFPQLSPQLYGQVRACRLLLQAPEQVRAVVAVDQSKKQAHSFGSVCSSVFTAS